MRRIRRCNTWRRARAWRSRTPWSSPPRSSATATTSTARSSYQEQRMNRTARVVLSARFFGAYIHAGGGARMLRNELLAKRDPDNPWEADWLYHGIDVPE